MAWVNTIFDHEVPDITGTISGVITFSANSGSTGVYWADIFKKFKEVYGATFQITKYFTNPITMELKSNGYVVGRYTTTGLPIRNHVNPTFFIVWGEPHSPLEASVNRDRRE